MHVFPTKQEWVKTKYSRDLEAILKGVGDNFLEEKPELKPACDTLKSYDSTKLGSWSDVFTNWAPNTEPKESDEIEYLPGSKLWKIPPEAKTNGITERKGAWPQKVINWMLRIGDPKIQLDNRYPGGTGAGAPWSNEETSRTQFKTHFERSPISANDVKMYTEQPYLQVSEWIAEEWKNPKGVEAEQYFVGHTG